MYIFGYFGNILRLFGTFYTHLVIQCEFGIYFPVLVYGVQKNLATMYVCRKPPIFFVTVKMLRVLSFARKMLAVETGQICIRRRWENNNELCFSPLRHHLDSRREKKIVTVHFSCAERAGAYPTKCYKGWFTDICT
jgi:hypothetical protein